MNNKENTAQRTASELLERPITLTMGDRTFDVPRPTLGTLVRISAEIVNLPVFPDYKDPEASDSENSVRFIQANLAVAKDCAPLATILAVAILGSENLEEERVVRKKLPMRGILGKMGLTYFGNCVVKVDNLSKLSQQIYHTYTPAAIQSALVTILNQSDLGDFFASITFLAGVNLMREVKTTAHGPSSPECAKPSA